MGSYTIDYFTLYSRDSRPFDLRSACRTLAGQDALISKSQSSPREIKHLRELRGLFEGTVVKYRVRDLPHKGSPGGNERELGLREDEGIIEKTHFIIAPGPGILLLQKNRNAATANTLAGLLGEFLNRTVIFAPVLRPEALERLMRDSAGITYVDVSVTTPAPEHLAEVRPARGQWSENVLSLMGNTGAATLSFTIKGNLHARDQRRFLGQNIVTGIRQLFSGPATVKRARVWFDSGEKANDFIDLMGDGLTDVVQVQDVGRYPNSEQIFSEMRQLWHERQAYLRQINDQESG